MSLKDIAHEMVKGSVEEKVKRSKHSIYVDDAQYYRFTEICKKYNKTPSEIIDRLIESYLAEVDAVTGGDVSELRKKA